MTRNLHGVRRSVVFERVGAIACVLCGCTCSTDFEERDAGGGSDARVADGSVDAGASHDAAAGGDGGERDGSGGDAGLRAPVGAVVIGQQGAHAFFVEPLPGCELQVIGPCEQLLCGPLGELPEQLSAGTITVTGGAVPLELRFDDGAYDPIVLSEPLWPDGVATTFSVAAAGADIAAFTTTVTSPVLPVWTSPDISGTTISIDPTVDLELRWSGGSGGTVLASFLAAKSTVGNVGLSCLFDLEAGIGVIPAEAMADLPPFESVPLSFGVVAVSTSSVDTGAHRVLVRASLPLSSFPALEVMFE
jgi:hypothetical protein